VGPEVFSASRVVRSVRDVPDERDRPWYDFIAYRRRFVSDLAWFGLGLTVVGIVASGADDEPWWLGIPIVVTGLGIVVAAIRRRLR
jgi:hypothetical protein